MFGMAKRLVNLFGIRIRSIDVYNIALAKCEAVNY